MNKKICGDWKKGVLKTDPVYLQFQSTLENCVFYFKKGKGVWFCWDYTQNIVIHQTEIMIMKKEVYIWGKVLWNENNAT